jgi:hypothetical protein
VASREEIAWAAGLFEGEGSVFANRVPAGTGRRNDSVSIVAALTTTDRDVVDRFTSIVSVGAVHTERRIRPRKARLVHHWRAYSANAIYVIELFWPFLGERRREQVMSAFERAGLARQHQDAFDRQRLTTPHRAPP